LGSALEPGGGRQGQVAVRRPVTCSDCVMRGMAMPPPSAGLRFLRGVAVSVHLRIGQLRMQSCQEQLKAIESVLAGGQGRREATSRCAHRWLDFLVASALQDAE